jgi:dienelactone hydrolase
MLTQYNKTLTQYNKTYILNVYVKAAVPYYPRLSNCNSTPKFIKYKMTARYAEEFFRINARWPTRFAIISAVNIPCMRFRETNATLKRLQHCRYNWGTDQHFWNVTPCSFVNIQRRLGETRYSRARHCLVLAGSLDYLSALKMQEARSSETSVNFYQAAWCHIPEDSILESDRRENFSFN